MNAMDVQQRTHEWFELRTGRVTASRIVDVMDFLKKGGEGAARKSYKAQVIAEILTGQAVLDGYLSPAMMHGNDYEDIARTAYEFKTGASVDLAGFALHPDIERAGASPDGLVGEDGGLELKCPKTETHLRYLLADEVPEEYRPQMYFGMACTGRQWWDFASYDPRLPDPLQLFTKRLPRDAMRIAEIEDAVLKFLAEADATIAELQKLVGPFSIGKPPIQEPERLASEGWLTDADFQGLV